VTESETGIVHQLRVARAPLLRGYFAFELAIPEVRIAAAPLRLGAIENQGVRFVAKNPDLMTRDG
jgi:hypothetical protein